MPELQDVRCPEWKANRTRADFFCVMHQGHGGAHVSGDGTKWRHPHKPTRIAYGMRMPKQAVRSGERQMYRGVFYTVRQLDGKEARVSV